MSVYLDYAATTPLSDAVQKSIIDHMSLFGNPSSLHRLGVESERKVKSVKALIADELGAKENEVIFTSGGTESNNLAVLGMHTSKSNARYITTAIEHPSVLNAFQQLEKRGHEVIYLNVDSNGIIDLTELENALNNDTVLVSIMAVNNEVGSIQPILEAGSMINKYNMTHQSQIKFHVDAVQAFGKIQLNMNQLKVDLMTISAHKIGALKGCGALIKRSHVTLKPLVYGGQQEYGIRPGTENLMGIVSFGAAIEVFKEDKSSRLQQVNTLRDKIVQKLTTLEGVCINGNGLHQSPYILNVSFLGVKAEVLLHALESKEIYVATGSACSSKKKSHSHVLKAMGFEDIRMEGSIRLSLSDGLSDADVLWAVEEIMNTANALRAIMQIKKRK